MTVPPKRRSSSTKRRRAAHFALKKTTLAICKKCGKEVLPHRVCAFCGYYAGREVVVPKTKKKSAKNSK